MRRVASLLLVFAFASPRAAMAAGPLPSTPGDPIRTSDYSVDLFQGPVLASSRVTALSGAYSAIAEGSEGIPFNPAAASLRMPYSTTNVDWDISGGFTLPTSVSGTDFDNNGDSTFQKQQNFFFGTLGGYIQVEHLALGAMLSLQSYALGQDPVLRLAQPPDPSGAPTAEKATDQINLRFFKIDPVVSYGFLDDQLHVGGGLRVVYVQLNADLASVMPDGSIAGDGTATDLFRSYAVGAQAGVLWAPYALPIRVGGAARSPLAATGAEFGGGFSADDQGDIRAGNTYLPRRADLPWEVEGGFAVQLWKRPLNLPWHDEDKVPVPDTERWRQSKNGQIEPPSRGARRLLRTRYRAIPRQKVLLTTSALVSGPVANAVGVESMLTGKLERSGERVSVTLRGGIETEVIPYWLVLRAGSYLEPTRFRTSSSRVHGTAGFQVRLFEWDVFGLADPGTIWRMSTAVDVARDYFAWSVGAGMFL